MPKSTKKNPRETAPKDRPVSQDDADQCKPNDGKPSSDPRKPKCPEGYPEQQPSDKDAG